MTLVAAVLLAAPAPLLDVQILPIHRSLAAGQSINVTVRVTNRSGKPLMVVPQPVAAHQLRGPNCDVEIRKEGSTIWTDISQHPTDPNDMPISVHDFAQISPHGHVDWRGPLFLPKETTPGKYVMRFIYRTDAPFDDWIAGVPDPQKMDKVAEIKPEYDQVPKGIFISKPQKFDVKVFVGG